MAGRGLTLEGSHDLIQLGEMIKAFPVLGRRVMAHIGWKGKLTVKGALMSGVNGVTLKKYPRDRKGRRTVSWNYDNRSGNAIAIRSYPMNLFESGRTLRSGQREPGRKIITGKMAVLVEAQLQRYASEATSEIIQKEMDRV